MLTNIKHAPDPLLYEFSQYTETVVLSEAARVPIEVPAGDKLAMVHLSFVSPGSPIALLRHISARYTDNSEALLIKEPYLKPVPLFKDVHQVIY